MEIKNNSAPQTITPPTAARWLNLIGMRFEDGGDGRRTVGFNIWDQPDVSPEEQNKNYEEARKLKDGPEKDALRQQAVANHRVFIGRTGDKQARITLSDGNSRPRIRLSVAADGEAKLEFLDVGGKVIQTLPAASGTTNK